MNRPRRGASDAWSAERLPLRGHHDEWADRRPGVSGEGATSGEAAYELLLRGREAQEDGDVDGALHYYRRAFAFSDAERHPADTSALFHNMACYSSLVGQEERTWKLFLASARCDDERFDWAQIEAGGISTSLGEAGLLLVDWRPPSLDLLSVSPRLLLTGVTPLTAAAPWPAVDASRVAPSRITR